MNRPSGKLASRRRAVGALGFSLIELMVAMAMFMVIGAAAMSLVKAHMPMASSAANQAGLTMNLRNALSQIELDAINAGYGSYPGTNMGDWPVGFTIINAPQGAACNNAATYTFGPNCYDTLNIMATDPTVLPMHPGPGTNTDNGTASLTVPAGETAASLAASLPPNTILLWVNPTGQPPSFTATTVTSATAAGAVVNITFYATTGGVNTPPPAPNDPYQIADHQGVNYKSGAELTNNFDVNSWVLKLNPITYTVDLTNPANPKLVRQQNGNTDVVAEQIIGFRVGASLRFPTTPGDSNFSFDSSNTGYNYDWAEVRAIRVSVIGRTTPSSDIAINFHNSFDGGPYKIQGLSVTVNPRNLSMTDQF